MESKCKKRNNTNTSTHGEFLFNVSVGKSFLTMTQNRETNRKIINKFYCIKKIYMAKPL